MRSGDCREEEKAFNEGSLKALKTELSGEPLTQVLAIFVQKLRPKCVNTCGGLIILVFM